MMTEANDVSAEPGEWTLAIHGAELVRGVIDPPQADALAEHILARAAAQTSALGPEATLADYMRASARENIAFPGKSHGFPDRVGHQLMRWPEVDRVLQSAAIQAVVAKRLSDAVLVSAALICKWADTDHSYGPHRDVWFLRPDPMDLLTILLALDDAPLAAGGLEIEPGSHLLPVTWGMKLGKSSWEQAAPGPQPWLSHTLVPVDLNAGDLLAIDGRLWHGSRPNRSSRPRRLLVAQWARPGAVWPADSWLSPNPQPEHAVNR